MHKRVIVYGMRDLFFRAKIEQVCRNLEASLSSANSLHELKSLLESNTNALVVFDIAGTRSELDDIAKACSISGAVTLGYYSHVDAEARAAATNARVENISTRSKLQEKLLTLIQERSEPEIV